MRQFLPLTLAGGLSVASLLVGGLWPVANEGPVGGENSRDVRVGPDGDRPRWGEGRGIRIVHPAVLEPLGSPDDASVPLARCFAPGTPWSTVHGSGMELPPVPDGVRFETTSHWTRTATEGAITQRGDPITLTWGIVPDGTVIPSFGLGNRAGSNLRARLDALYEDGEATWLAHFQSVFDQWGEVTGVTYIYEPNDDGVAFSDGETGAGVLGVRPDVRIGGRPIDGDLSTLAFNFFPSVGDMVIDTEDRFYEDLSNNSLNLRNAVSHEHGHGLGLPHVCPVNETKLMEPFASRQFVGPQHDDILSAQRHHGDPREPNDSLAAATDLGVLGSEALEVDLVSLDGASDVDYYAFRTDRADLQLAIVAWPVGSTYLRGPQVGTCTSGESFDSLRARDLRFELLDGDGNGEVLARSNVSGSGNAEVLHFFTGATLEKMLVLRVSGESRDTAQRYAISITPVSEANDLSIMLSAAPNPVLLGGTQTVWVDLRHSGPATSENVVVNVAFPDGLVVEGAEVVAGAGELTWTEGAVVFDAEAFQGAGHSRLNIETRAVGVGRATIAAALSTPGAADPIAANDQASLEVEIEDGSPHHVEEFEAFPGLTGRPGSPVPNDTTGSFDLRYDYAATTFTGFSLDEIVAQNGRGLHFLASEDNAMETTVDFPPAVYDQPRHQLAFWFRFNDVSEQPPDTLSQALFVYNRGATNLAYHLQCGVDHDGRSGAGMVVPIGGGEVSTPSHQALAPDQWHTVVVQYQSATNTMTLDGGIRVWFNPANADAPPSFEIRPSDGLMGAEFGAGAFGRYAFGAAAFPANADGPDIWIDRIGSWNGYGDQGVNDLEAAIGFLYSQVGVEESMPRVAEGDSAGGELVVEFVRRGDLSVPGLINWEVVVAGSGANSAEASDFPEGTLPSGQVTFAAGSERESLGIPLAPDREVEPDEVVEIHLRVVREAFRLDTPVIRGLIVNDDGIPTTEVALDIVGNLVVRDIDAPSDDRLTIQADASRGAFLVSDAEHYLATEIASASGHGTLAVSVPFEVVRGSALAVRTGSGDDAVSIDLATGAFPLPVSYRGGDVADADALHLVGAAEPYAKGTFWQLRRGDGLVEVGNELTLIYTGLELIEAEALFATAVVAFGDAAERITLREASEGFTALESNHGVPIVLRHPAEALQLDGGDGADQLVVHSLAEAYPASLSFDGGSGVDTIQIEGDLLLDPSRSLITVAETIRAGEGGPLRIDAAEWRVEGAASLGAAGPVRLRGDLTFAPASVLSLAVGSGGHGEVPLQLVGDHRAAFEEASLEVLLRSPLLAGVEAPLIQLGAATQLVSPFGGLSEGAQVQAVNGAALFEIGYGGGDGDDIVLKTLLDYAQWRSEILGKVPDPLMISDKASDDLDGDGWLDGLEYVLGLNPGAYDDVSFTIDFSGGNAVTITYDRDPLVPKGLETLIYSENLLDWLPVTDAESTLERGVGSDGRDRVTWTFALQDAQRFFYQLRVNLPDE